jgi:hypothetical protein
MAKAKPPMTFPLKPMTIAGSPVANTGTPVANTESSLITRFFDLKKYFLETHNNFGNPAF